jgi:hypothetical protein
MKKNECYYSLCVFSTSIKEEEDGEGEGEGEGEPKIHLPLSYRSHILCEVPRLGDGRPLKTL